MRGSPGRIQQLVVLEGRAPSEIEALAAAAAVEIRRVDALGLADICSPALARGVVAVATPPAEHTIEALIEGEAEGGRRVLVALDGVQDPHNLGAILRSAEFFGAAGAFWPRDRAAGVTPVAVRTSAGATERLPLARVTNLARALELAKDAGYWVIGTVVDDGRSLREICAQGLPERLVVVLGSEEKGIRRLTRERCDFLATIPRSGEIGSLNVSAAGAVCLAFLSR
ncbi:MAG: 23S rRNA (guanosine(2251)-2'-O)-methyltransferase RlmB [Myxococcales bacterium]|nr:23S rRNA (guanosine(2251)-2'-O)-methyltransferase RlmB [Myxococcales bacterium]